MKTKEQVEHMLDLIMGQYASAGCTDVADIDSLIWRTEIMDKCSAALDVLSWVLYDNDSGVDGMLIGSCDCKPAKPYGCYTSEEELEGYNNYKRQLKGYLK